MRQCPLTLASSLLRLLPDFPDQLKLSTARNFKELSACWPCSTPKRGWSRMLPRSKSEDNLHSDMRPVAMSSCVIFHNCALCGSSERLASNLLLCAMFSSLRKESHQPRGKRGSRRPSAHLDPDSDPTQGVDFSSPRPTGSKFPSKSAPPASRSTQESL